VADEHGHARPSYQQAEAMSRPEARRCTSSGTLFLLCFRVAIPAIGGQADLRPALFDYLLLAAVCRGTT
jgi:hypothetical protein